MFTHLFKLIWNKKNAYKVLASANIDYGQCNFALKRYMASHPEIKWPEIMPAPGYFILGINDYLDLKETGKYGWLKTFEPYDHVDHCYLLFKVNEEDLLQKHLK